MNPATHGRPYISEVEYRGLEEESDVKHEYFEGQMYAMQLPSLRHMDVAMNIFASLHEALRGTVFKARMSQQRLKVEVDGLITYPDVVVLCGPGTYDPDSPDTLIDAVAIVEVVSTATATYDSGWKFNSYRQLLSLRHFLLVNQDKAEVEHRFKDAASGEWSSRIFAGTTGTVDLSAIGCQSAVSVIYEGVEFEEAADTAVKS